MSEASAARRRRAIPRARAFTTAEARRAGWTDDAIRHAVRTGRWVRVHRGVFARPIDVPLDKFDTRRRQIGERAIAAARVCNRATISHASAAILHGLPTVGAIRRPCLTVPAGTATSSLAVVHLHRATLAPADVIEMDGSQVTAVARTVVDVAREAGVAPGLAAADSAVRHGLTDHARLADALNACAGWPGRSRAARVVELCDGAAESALESISRLRMHEHGLPLPQVQVDIGDEWGGFLARVDFYWPEFGVIGEADGLVKYEERQDVIAEKRRQELVERLGPPLSAGNGGTRSDSGRWLTDCARPSPAASVRARDDAGASSPSTTLCPEPARVELRWRHFRTQSQRGTRAGREGAYWGCLARRPRDFSRS